MYSNTLVYPEYCLKNLEGKLSLNSLAMKAKVTHITLHLLMFVFAIISTCMVDVCSLVPAVILKLCACEELL